MQEATFYLNDEGILFIMKTTVLIAFLKIASSLNIACPWKIVFFFFLAACLKLKLCPLLFFYCKTTGSLQRNQKKYRAFHKTVNTESKRKTPPLHRLIKKEFPEWWKRVFPFHLMFLIAVLMNGLNLSYLSCSTEKVIFSSCSPKLLLLLYSGISIDTLSILLLQAQ